MDINTVTLTGRLGSDIELRTTPGGKEVAEVNLAVQSGWGDNERTNWIGLTLWGKSAEAAAKHLAKGSKIAISGRLTQESWEKDGKKHSKTKVTVENWTFADAGPATKKGDYQTRGRDGTAPQRGGQDYREPIATSDDEEDDIPF